MTTTTYSSDKDVNAQIASLVRAGWKFQARGRSKHAKIMAPNGRKMTVPYSPSDWRALRNLRRDAERLAMLPSAKTKRP
ncbi:hypothetical protein [Burkholderia vietnamiensis]|uniref:hypothetical protein n=1 Tax=Burkholderia vietnamiensis TaxID=60552 RepID=UPI001594BE3B|nr:hypothetical protein [Burkholderia vietnamiensis]